MQRIQIFILAFFSLQVVTTLAEVPPADASPWQISVAVGYGERGNPLINSEDVPVILEFDVGWYGKRFFFDSGDLGYTLSDNDNFTLNTVVRANSDRLFFSRADIEYVVIITGVTASAVEIEAPDRDYAIEWGVEFLSDGFWGRAQLSAFHDVSNTHRGFEISGQYTKGFRKQRWYFESSIGVSFKNSQLNDYYWGFTPVESSSLPAAYRVGSGLNTSLRLSLSYQITRHWAAVGTWRTEWLSSQIANSPIVADDTVSSKYVGLRYTF